MTEKPIIFTAESVRAIRDGKKTQSRRLVKLARLHVVPRGAVRPDLAELMQDSTVALGGVRYRAQHNPHGAVSALVGGQWLGMKPGEFDFVCPYGDGVTHLGKFGEDDQRWVLAMAPASMLWVKETWQAWRRCSIEDDDWEPVGVKDACRSKQPDFEDGWRVDAVEYRANGKSIGPWTSPIFMPRWASRYSLSLHTVRLERLHQINDAEVRAEGVDDIGEGDGLARIRFGNLWDKINFKSGKPAAFASNPWVWTLCFRYSPGRDRQGLRWKQARGEI